jgi:hypothetical protein
MDVGPEGRVEFLNNDIDLLDQGEIVEKAMSDAASYVLQELRGLLHLMLYSLINLGIVNRIFHLIGLHRTGYVNLQGEVDNKFIAYQELLRQNPVVGKEMHVI